MNIVITGHFGFPTGSAAASRIRHLARGLVELGHQVSVIVMSPSIIEQGDDACDGWSRHAGIRYRNARAYLPGAARPSRLRRMVGLVSDMRSDARRVCATLETMRASGGVDVVIGYSLYAFGMNQILRYCRSTGIPFVADVVEWVGPDSFAGGKCNPLYWDSERAIRRLLPKCDGIIAISSYLERYFQSKGLPTVRVPAIIDLAEAPEPAGAPARPRTGRYVLTYLGNMVERDGPMLMIDAIRQAVQAGCNVQFNVVGGTERVPEAQRAKAAAEADATIRDRVRFWGRVSDEAVRDHLTGSDALIFTRTSGRASSAAFPTRLPEYLVTGKPVIASGVSDIGEYLREGVEALVIKPDSSTALADAIAKLVASPDGGKSIGEAGRRKCAECFDYAKRAAEVEGFLSKLAGCATPAHGERKVAV